jgi:high-affinity iron transporter
MKVDGNGRSKVSTNRLIAWSIGLALVFVIAVSMVASSSNADPTDVAPGSQSLVTSVVNASVIVFREGLEAVLIFAAITASFLGARQQYRRPVMLGVGAAFVATVVTWFVMVAVVGSLPVSEDMLLAITGVAAVVVLLLVMNWFFHKVYWTDHIKELNSKKKGLVQASESGGGTKYWGFVALGFTAVYREGFEVVLFLQNLNIVAGGKAVFLGVLFGLAGTVAVGFLTFYLHHKLPYKRMLVLTGVLLGMVLVVMVGGSARTLQALGALPTTPLGVSFPDWWARWFEVVPTVETVLIQVIAAIFVVGSYYAAEWWSKEKRRRARSRPGTDLGDQRPASTTSVATAPAAELSAPSGHPLLPDMDDHRSPIAAPRAFQVAAAFPEMAFRAPQLLGSRAAARELAREREGEDVPRTVCGHEATTLCGSDARQPIAASRLSASSSPEGSHQPVSPQVRAPMLAARSLFEGSARPHALNDRAPFSLPLRAWLATDDGGVTH